MTTQKTLETRYPQLRDTDVQAVIVTARKVRAERAERYLRDGGRFLIEVIGGLFGGLAKLIRQRAAIRELQQLDDHMLADIGLSRSQITAAATGRLPHPRLLQDAGRIVSRFAHRLADWERANHANDYLRRMDDRLLADIGLTRGDIRLAEGSGSTEPAKRRDRDAA